MLIYAFCKSCESEPEPKIGFVTKNQIKNNFMFTFMFTFTFTTLTKRINDQTNCHITLEILKKI